MWNIGDDMYIETEHLIIRDFIISDAAQLLALKYDEQILKYNPSFIKQEATIDDVKECTQYLGQFKNNYDFTHETYYAICLKETNVVIGAITVSHLEYLYELQMGWVISSEHTGNGYAAEAGSAVSDYLLEKLSLDFICAVMDTDNHASFQTAQKCGFKLFEKRVPYDYHYSDCNAENFNEVNEYLTDKQNQLGSCYYYFRKFNKGSKITSRFYGDTKYDGRFS